MINYRTKEIRLERKKRTYPEFHLHKQIADYYAKIFISGQSLWHTTDNSNNMGGPEARRAQAKQRLLGAVAGFPDGVIMYSGSQILLIEIKAPNGTLQDNQKELHHTLVQMGFHIEIIRSLDEFREIIKDYNIPCREVY